MPQVRALLLERNVPLRLRAALTAYTAVESYDPSTREIELAARNSSAATIQLHEIYRYILRFDVAKKLLETYGEEWPSQFTERTSGMVKDIRVLRDKFRDDQTLDVQIVPKDGATTTFVVFTSRRHGFGISLNTFHHCWLAELGINVIYLRDLTETLYLEGIPSLGNLNETIVSLRNTLASLGTKHVACLGYSAGVYGALHYGALLPANKVLCFSGPTSIDIGIDETERDVYVRLGEKRAAGEIFPDMRKVYQRAPNTNAAIYYGEKREFDRLQAENMSGLPNVQLHPLNTSKHFVLDKLARRGKLEIILASTATPKR